VVFVSFNFGAAYSTDGGSHFTIIDPTTIFPPLSADGVGLCCGQIVQYAPGIDRFIWLMQGAGVTAGGRGAYRLATASPQQIISSGGAAWTYWNLYPGVFGQPDNSKSRTDFVRHRRQFRFSRGSMAPASSGSAVAALRQSIFE
jgi:hypothetical protein